MRKYELTVVLSVILSTNFPSDAFHFTQYRVCKSMKNRDISDDVVWFEDYSHH